MDRLPPPVTMRRPDLYARATRLAGTISARYGAALPSDLREVLGYWQSCERGLERAAEHLIAYADALGIPEDPRAPAPERDQP